MTESPRRNLFSVMCVSILLLWESVGVEGERMNVGGGGTVMEYVEADGRVKQVTCSLVLFGGM